MPEQMDSFPDNLRLRAEWRVLLNEEPWIWTWEELGSTGPDGKPGRDAHLASLAISNARHFVERHSFRRSRVPKRRLRHLNILE